MSPFEIGIAMAFYTSPMGYVNTEGNALAAEIIDSFQEDGLLMPRVKGNTDHHDLEATNKLNAYCNALTVMPLPVETWAIPGCDFDITER